jgi:hypothetical protein
MNTVYEVVVTIFVLGVLSVVGYAIWRISPWGRHTDHFRDPETGEHRWEESPHLETWHEFEQQGHTSA